MTSGTERSFTGKLKAASNLGVKLYGLCAAARCKLEAVTILEGVGLCDYHRDRVTEFGTVANECHGPNCTRPAARVLGPVGHMLCKSHAHQRFVLGVNGPWQGRREPLLRPLDPTTVTAYTKRGLPLLDRFMMDVQGDFETGCWNWTGSVHTSSERQGQVTYGAFWINNDRIDAHRWAWANVAGLPLIDGMVIDHICENKLCVRPGHLQQISNADNLKMGKTRRQPPPGGMVVVRHRGHRTMRELTIAMQYGLPFDIGKDPTVIVEPFTD